EKSKEIGIHLHLNTEVKSIEKKDSIFIVTGTNGSESLQLECDLVLHGAGRVPEIDDMQLDKGNVTREKRGVSVNEYLQSTSNPRVYAAGDAA
ncbi:FAD-dependent oxidoreductase, partial [Klebsiella pneumoniae]|nr:FAD-dependent oxidoreductase [Klebsiella pneumoniae]